MPGLSRCDLSSQELADLFGGLGVAPVSFVGVDLGQGLDVVPDASGHGGQRFAGVELGAGVPVTKIM